MTEPKIIVIEKIDELIDDGEIIGRLVTDKTGKEWKVKTGQGGKLKKRWEELDGYAGKAIELTIGEYKGYPFVADFELVKDKLAQQAADRVSTKMADSKNRAFALSYAKDWCIAKVQAGVDLKTTDVITVAVLFESYLDNGAEVVKKKEVE